MTEQTLEIPLQPAQSPPMPVTPKRKFNLPKIAILLIAILLIGGGAIYAVKHFTQPKICTLEAKICPDGLTVGRVLPNCEFAPCPALAPTVTATSTPDETVNWKSYKNEKYGYEIKLPPNWGEYSMKDFSFSETIAGNEQYLYLGPEGSINKPPQSVQITVEDKEIVEKRKREGMQPGGCTEETVRIGRDRISANKTFCNEWQRGSSFAIEKGSYVYIIDNVMNDSSYWPTFDQILSTFKFLE